MRRLRVDTTTGMFFSNMVAWFIILVGAVVLNSADVTTITTATDAAEALRPLVNSSPNSGYIAQLIFAVGVIGIGLLLNFIGMDPLQALVLTAVINGIVAVPLIYFIIRLSGRRDIMGANRSGVWSRIGLWAAFILMAAAAIALFVSLF